MDTGTGRNFQHEALVQGTLLDCSVIKWDGWMPVPLLLFSALKCPHPCVGHTHLCPLCKMTKCSVKITKCIKRACKLGYIGIYYRQSRKGNKTERGKRK